ncbi:uncharacterized protein N7483_012616 [Penicillium malachiteum]|uniref:uncharacterized protein n=1 Tax=Penicillium malachiteum TaxID=1324776 RepID=UPI0025489D65|nr:uncharacterized protein N7483_012616 [Penicillium malachiteum]KAJ5715435.1 hypothetical protein N7483_012616 [Penicillium malachiteum]
MESQRHRPWGKSCFLILGSLILNVQLILPRWNSYNHYSCSPNETIIHSNAQALVDLGLADLGYQYVTTDCGWTVPDRLANGSLTWNAELFPSGFFALGDFLHNLGLLFGVYEDAGVETCSTTAAGTQAGSLYHEAQDVATFKSWGVDALKYDNCYSDAATDYPDTDYTPSVSPRYHYENMSNTLAAQDETILFQICDWGVDFPALWAPELGNTWRIANDIIPDWRTIFRILNQAVPNTPFAGSGQWPDLDMLEVGNDVFTTPEEQTHFSMWAILKSPLTIGAALKDDATSIAESSLEILMNEDVIAFNQDSLGESASLRRRWTEDGFEVWSGSLEGEKTVVALINWDDETRDLTLDLPIAGFQSAGLVKNIWANETVENVKTTYSAFVEGHGVMLLELGDTTEAGTYSTSLFGSSTGTETTFSSVYANTTSSKYTIDIIFTSSSSKATTIKLSSSTNTTSKSVSVPASGKTVSSTLSLTAGFTNTITIESSLTIESIKITSPTGTYYTGKDSFTLSGDAIIEDCTNGTVTGCAPVGYKIGYISASNKATATIKATVSSANGTEAKYIELDYINNDIALSTSWDWGSNSRNITVALNGGSPVRLEVPLSGRHSELYSAGLGWWDTATLGILVDGWKDGDNEVVIANAADTDVSQTWGADFVGLRFYD